MTNDRMQAAVRQKLDSELSALRTSAQQRENLCQNAIGGYQVKRKLTVGLMIALILFLTTVTALAMELSGTGVLDWLYRRDREQEMTTTVPEVSGATEHRTASLEVRELITDGYGVYLSLAVTPKEEGTLFLSNYTDPYWTKAAELGFPTDDPEQSIAEWAAVNGYQQLKEIRLYGAYTENEDGSATSENLFHIVRNPIHIESDGTSVFLIACENKGEGHVYKLCYRVLTYPDEETYHQSYDDPVLENAIVEYDDYEERVITFTVDTPQGMEAEVLAEYLPDPEHEQSSEFPQVTGLRILRTPLSAYYDVTYVHPAPGELRRYYFGEPSFITDQLYDRSVRMTGWYAEPVSGGSQQFHELHSCILPDPPLEEITLECAMEKRDPEFGDTIWCVYKYLPLLLQ
ncbi:MAG: hypothetical protein IKK08_05495 [Clostridia bacterium]|nr:hypothetical protein [Clostridia bacterium]